MFCLLVSNTEQHFDVEARMSYRAHHGWTESYEKSIPVTSAAEALTSWPEAWLATGFTHRGTKVPKRVAPRIELGRRLANFFATHHEYEVPFAGATAEAALAHSAEITAAERELRSAQAAVKSNKRERDAAEKSLRHEMYFVVVILSRQLGKSDPRWSEFGLKQPRPDAPPASVRYGKGVSVTAPTVVDFSPESAAPGSDKSAA
jgi:hypothetical protein